MPKRQRLAGETKIRCITLAGAGQRALVQEMDTPAMFEYIGGLTDCVEVSNGEFCVLHDAYWERKRLPLNRWVLGKKIHGPLIIARYKDGGFRNINEEEIELWLGALGMNKPQSLRIMDDNRESIITHA